MASATLTLSATAPKRGETVTATYAVSGNAGTPARSATVTGKVTVGDQPVTVETTITFPATDPLAEKFEAPAVAGLTFVATGDPHVWTAVVA